MALGGFLQGLGLALGNSMIQGQKYEQNQARLELEKSQAEQSQMQAQQMQQQMKTQKDLGAFIKSQTDLNSGAMATAAGQAQLYSKAAGFAASQGDFASASEMTKLAENAQDEGRRQAVLAQQQKQQANEDLANTADAYASNPTRDGAIELAKKAIAAGQNPASIPANLNSPEGQAWINQQKLAGMDSKARAEFVQKAYEMKENRDQRERDHQDNVSIARATQQATAAYRDGILELKRAEIASRGDREPKIVTIGNGQYEFDATGSMKGERLASDPRYVKLSDKVTSQQISGAARLNEAVGEGARALTNMASFDVTSRASPFSHLGAKTPFDALVKVGSQALTSDQMQMIPVSGANLGNQIASAEAAFGGRMANGSQQDHIEQVTTPQSGDSGLTAAYKLANGKEIFETVLKYAPEYYRNSADAKAHMEELSKINWSTQDVIAAARKQADGGKAVQTLRDLGAATAEARKIVDSNKPSGTESSNSTTPPSGGGLPQGWSVQVH